MHEDLLEKADWFEDSLLRFQLKSFHKHSYKYLHVKCYLWILQGDAKQYFNLHFPLKQKLVNVGSILIKIKYRYFSGEKEPAKIPQKAVIFQQK